MFKSATPLKVTVALFVISALLLADTNSVKVKSLLSAKATALATVDSFDSQKANLLKIFAESNAPEYDYAALGDRLSGAASGIADVFKNGIEFLAKYKGLAKGLKVFASAMPIASIALDLYLGKSNPDIQKIQETLDKLETKIDDYQRVNTQAFADVRTDICESEMNDEISVLSGL